MKILRIAITALVSVLPWLVLAPVVVNAQAPPGTLEETIPPGENFDKAEFRLWVPDGSVAVRAIIVLVPGPNGDGRAMADDPEWRAFAATHTLALIACPFTDRPHEQNFIEHYVNRSHGSGRALLDALAACATRSRFNEDRV